MQQETVVILLMGEYGVGKTRACAELVNVGRCGEVLFVNVDNGLQTLRLANGEIRPGCHVTPWLSKPDDIEKTFKKIFRREGVPDSVQTLVIDSMSAIDLRATDHAFGLGAPGFGWESLDDGVKAKQQAWGHRGAIVQRYARMAPSAPYNYVIITAHTKEKLDKSGEVEQILPLVGSANTINVVGGACTHVFHLGQVASGKRVLTINNNGKIRAKCRSEALVEAVKGAVFTDKKLAELITYL